MPSITIWCVSFLYPLSMIGIDRLLVAYFGLGPRVTLDVVEEMSDIRNAKDAVRNVYTNIALIGALLLTVVFAMLILDPPTCDSCGDEELLQTLYITSIWTS